MQAQQFPVWLHLIPSQLASLASPERQANFSASHLGVHLLGGGQGEECLCSCHFLRSIFYRPGPCCNLGGTVEQYNAGRLHSEAGLLNYLPVGAGSAPVKGEPSAQSHWHLRAWIFEDQALINPGSHQHATYSEEMFAW